MQRERPIGVTIIGILDILGGLIFLAAGFGLFVAIPIIASNPDQFSISSSSLAFKLLTSGLGYALAGGSVTLGIAGIVIGVGLLKGKQWAWKAAVAIAFISVALDIIMVVVSASTNLTSSVIGWIIYAVILYYLYRPHVKAYFGKTAEPTPL